ncbi:argininosuccinate synthase-related protein [Streptomyces sp. NPDC032940]|uniref:argininosuccinate synthase-related protein n=1 Tax=Streptomyces sp. NPDC032940 TaxID=3155366 RepID=UPI0033C2FD89
MCDAGGPSSPTCDLPSAGRPFVFLHVKHVCSAPARITELRKNQLVRSFSDVTKSSVDLGQPVVVLFSGGLDSTYLLHRLKQAGATEVHALTVDLGGDEGAADARPIAEQLGVRLHIADARSVFADEFVAPAIGAHAIYLDTHPVSSSLSRPLIARIAVDTAQAVGAKTILHTANRSQNSLRRLNGALELLGFTGHYGSPYDLDPVDRARKMLELRDLGVGAVAERMFSGDSNLWCREFESGSLDDPESHAVPEELYRWTAERGRPGSEYLEIAFQAGVPVGVDGEKMPLTSVVSTLNERVGRHGLGRHTGLEHLADGVKVLEVREAPAAWILMRSHRHLETAALEAELIREKMHIEQLWVREALEGRWYGELRSACQAFLASCSAPVTGTVRWLLSAGRADTTSITAATPRYTRNREDWERSCIEAELSRLS